MCVIVLVFVCSLMILCIMVLFVFLCVRCLVILMSVLDFMFSLVL